MISDKAFRKYDIRAIIEKELPIKEVYKLGKSICKLLKDKKPDLKTIAVGMDVRIHSRSIKDELCRAILDSELNMIFIGECASPTLYYATKVLDVQAGIMITASHNDKEYNGLKILLGDECIWDKDIQRISKFYSSECLTESNSPGTLVLRSLKNVGGSGNFGRGILSEKLILDEYISMLHLKFKHLENIDLNIGIDCGNGTAALIIPKLVKKFNWKKVKLIFDNVDGNFPNHEPDPTKEANLAELKKAIKMNNLDYGLALDGDCDRLAVMDSFGELICGDNLLTLFAINLEQKGNIVFDIKCSNNVQTILTKSGHKPYISATGHARIKERMKETSAILGGELSGHYCFKDKYYGYDDAIYALLRFLEIYISSQHDKSLCSFWPKQINTPEFRIKCGNIDPHKIVQKVKEDLSSQQINLITIDGIRIEKDNGWAILRASNTEPILSFRFEANSKKELNNLKQIIYNSLVEINKTFKVLDLKNIKKEIDLRQI